MHIFTEFNLNIVWNIVAKYNLHFLGSNFKRFASIKLYSRDFLLLRFSFAITISVNKVGLKFYNIFWREFMLILLPITCNSFAADIYNLFINIHPSFYTIFLFSLFSVLFFYDLWNSKDISFIDGFLFTLT